MEFCEKLQQLRKQKGLTQEELAGQLFVSRTAISKWESGRGYPGIDSLRALSAFFGVTIDALLSGDELLTLAEADGKHRESRLRDLTFGLLDLSASLCVFLPLFGQRSGVAMQAVSLLTLTGASPWLRAVYFVAVLGMIAMGVLLLALQGWQRPRWERSRHLLSLLLNAAAALVFIISQQPYAAALLFIFLLVKGATLLKTA